MASIHFVVYQADAPTPTPAQVGSGYGWVHTVFADSAVARETSGTQTFAAVTSLTPGSYRVAFVYYGTEFSDVIISGIETIGIPSDRSPLSRVIKAIARIRIQHITR